VARALFHNFFVIFFQAFLKLKYTKAPLEEAIKILDLAYLIGEPVDHWDLPAAIDIVLGGIRVHNYSDDQRQLSCYDRKGSCSLLGDMAIKKYEISEEVSNKTENRCVFRKQSR